MPPSFGTLVIRSERQIPSALLKVIYPKYSNDKIRKTQNEHLLKRKVISILAGNLNLGHSYLIITVALDSTRVSTLTMPPRLFAQKVHLAECDKSRKL